MNIYLVKFMNENRSPYVACLKEKINTSLETGNLFAFNEYLGILKNFFYSTINSFDGEVFL